MVRNEFPNPPAELDELEFATQRLEIECVFHPDFCHHPLDRLQKKPKMRFRSRRANFVGLLEQVWILSNFSGCREGLPRNLERSALEDQLDDGHRFVSSPIMLSNSSEFERTRTFMNCQSREAISGLRTVFDDDDRKISEDEPPDRCI
jgi:hypothetical protein